MNDNPKLVRGRWKWIIPSFFLALVLAIIETVIVFRLQPEDWVYYVLFVIGLIGLIGGFILNWHESFVKSDPARMLPRWLRRIAWPLILLSVGPLLIGCIILFNR